MNQRNSNEWGKKKTKGGGLGGGPKICNRSTKCGISGESLKKKALGKRQKKSRRKKKDRPIARVGLFFYEGLKETRPKKIGVVTSGVKKKGNYHQCLATMGGGRKRQCRSGRWAWKNPQKGGGGGAMARKTGKSVPPKRKINPPEKVEKRIHKREYPGGGFHLTPTANPQERHLAVS